MTFHIIFSRIALLLTAVALLSLVATALSEAMPVYKSRDYLVYDAAMETTIVVNAT
jgi:hypothetical protein